MRYPYCYDSHRNYQTRFCKKYCNLFANNLLCVMVVIIIIVTEIFRHISNEVFYVEYTSVVNQQIKC
jgi:hypothetical protein